MIQLKCTDQPHVEVSGWKVLISASCRDIGAELCPMPLIAETCSKSLHVFDRSLQNAALLATGAPLKKTHNGDSGASTSSNPIRKGPPAEAARL